MVDYLTDEEQAERLKNWWERHGTSLVIGVVVAVSAAFGWRYYQSHTTDQANAASAAFTAYVEARAIGEAVSEPLAILDDEYAGTTYHILSLLYRVTDRVEEEDWEGALAYLEQAIEMTDARVIEDTARYRAAKVLYQLERYEQALDQLAQIRGDGFRVSAAELSGDIHIAQEDTAAARDAYRAGVEAATAGTRGLELLKLKLSSLVDQPS